MVILSESPVTYRISFPISPSYPKNHPILWGPGSLGEFGPGRWQEGGPRSRISRGFRGSLSPENLDISVFPEAVGLSPMRPVGNIWLKIGGCFHGVSHLGICENCQGGCGGIL